VNDPGGPARIVGLGPRAHSIAGVEEVRDIAARPPAYWRVLAVLCTLAVLVMCFLPGSAVPASPAVNFDKLVHALAFCAVAFAWRRAGLSLAATLALGLALAAFTEGGQAVLRSGRTGDVADFAADAFGVAVGLLIAQLGVRR